MRLLGHCPQCSAEDTLVVGKEAGFGKERVECKSCGLDIQPEESLWAFLSTEEERGNKLLPVEVLNLGLSVELAQPPVREVPHSRLIAEVLNTALIMRFDLRVCFATEGGVTGHIDKGPVELRNIYGNFGLAADDYFHVPQANEEVLRWYEELLRALFEEELGLDDRSYGRGEILKLSDEPGDESNVMILLWVVLTQVADKGFAVEVFRKLEELRGRLFGAGHLAGLTGGDIAAMFVIPPGLEGFIERPE